MVNSKEVEELITWKNDVGTAYVSIEDDFINPLIEAFGDDVEEILAYLNNMCDADLFTISGTFEYIYEKFMTDDVYDALGELEKRTHDYADTITQ